MKVYVQCDKNMIPKDYDHFNAYSGFYEMGFETVFFNTYDQLKESAREDVVIGYIGTVNRRLSDFGVAIENLDYPESIRKYLGRQIWTSKVDTINSNPELWPVFIKPVANKKFVGRVIRTTADLIGCGSCYDNADVICSEVLDFVTEYRVFVRYGEILDARKYKGDWSVPLDRKVVEECVLDFENAPQGYAIDFGVTRDGRTVLVEVNNTCSLGSYGLYCVNYAKLLSARWAELVGVEDECNF